MPGYSSLFSKPLNKMERKLIILYVIFFHVTSSWSHDNSHISVDEILSMFGDNGCIEGSMLSLEQPSASPSVTLTEEDGVPEVMVDIENEESMDTHQWDPTQQWEPSVLDFHNSETIVKKTMSSTKTKSFLPDFGMKNPMNVVNELSNLLKIPAQYSVSSVRGPPHERVFHMNLKLGDEEYSAAGSSLKQAQHLAARTLLQHTRYQMPLQQMSSKMKYPNSNAGMKSPTSLVYEIAAKQKLPVSFEVEDVVGPPNRPTFTTKCMLGNKISWGQGNSKKLSKRAAAEKMLMQVNSVTSPILDSWGTTNSRKKSQSGKRKSRKRNLLKAFQKMIAEMQTRTASAANLVSDFLDFYGSNSSYGKGLMEQMTKFARVLNSDSHFTDEIVGKSHNNKNHHHKGHSGDFSSQISQTHKPKETLMDVAHLLDFDIQFSDLPKRHNGDVLSLLSLSTKQPTVCYGYGSTAESAHDQAALRALKALSKMDPQMVVSLPRDITKESAGWKDWFRWVQDSIKEAYGGFLVT